MGTVDSAVIFFAEAMTDPFTLVSTPARKSGRL